MLSSGNCQPVFVELVSVGWQWLEIFNRWSLCLRSLTKNLKKSSQHLQVRFLCYVRTKIMVDYLLGSFVREGNSFGQSCCQSGSKYRRTWLSETLRLKGNKSNCFPWGQSSNVLSHLLTQKNEKKTAKKWFAWCQLAHKLFTVLRCTTWSHASRKFKLFPLVVKKFCWPLTRDKFSNRKTYLS